MTKALYADASPEKRLFISLLTRDISLVEAFLDLIDNSVNSAIEPYSDRLKTAADYHSLYVDEAIIPHVDIRINIAADYVEIWDTATGIPATVALDHVFKFGRSKEERHPNDRLSVYGIGLKRAIFKLGKQISIQSEHAKGGFNLDLSVNEWARDGRMPWSFPIVPRDPVGEGKAGTKIVVTELSQETKRRLGDGVFVGDLKEAIGRTYMFYLIKFVNIFLNGQQIEAMDLFVGSNSTSENFAVGDVSYNITAGLAVPRNGSFRERQSGWYVFCNGRTVVYADRTSLTGWGVGMGLPTFQPKHRPFIGIVFFVATDPENLPWKTTKAGIDEDSTVWQQAKREMAAVGRTVVRFLDSRYSDESPQTLPLSLDEAGGKQVDVISSAAAGKRQFTAPTMTTPETIRIQYDARIVDVTRIAKHLGMRSMGGADVGRYTFNWFLENEVEDE